MDRQYQELRNKYKIPFVIDDDPHNANVVESILQAADFTLTELGVAIDSYNQFNYDDITREPIESNGRTHGRYQRKNNFSDIPVLVITKTVYRPDGMELIAAYQPKNKIVLMAHSEDVLKDFLTNESTPLSHPLLAGIITIEEIIHFYQDTHLHRNFGNGTVKHFGDLANHSKDPIEREAALIFNEVAPRYAQRFHSFSKPIYKVPEYFTE